MNNKEDNFKEKFKQALISTAKVISDDYKFDLNNKNKNLSSKNIDFFELDNLKNRQDFVRLRAKADSKALKKNFLIKRYIKIIYLITLHVELCMTYLKKLDMNF